MIGFIQNWFKKYDRIVYIRLRKGKITFYHYPQGISYEDEPVIAVKKKGKTSFVSGVGKAIYDLKSEDTSVVYEPFNPFSYEPDNLNLAVKVIRKLIEHKSFKYSLVSPKMIIHPDKSYLSEMEEQIYRELALMVGAREVVVYVGDELQPDELEGVMQNR